MRKFKLFALLLGIFSLIGFTQIVKAEGTSVPISIKINENGSETTPTNIPEVNLHSVLNYNASGTGNFMFWTVNGVVRSDLPQNLSIRVTSKLELVAYFATNYTVAFLDANTKLLTVNFVSADDSLTPPTTEPTRPGAEFLGYAPIQDYETAPANKTPANPGSKAYLVAKYQVNDVATNKFTVTIDDVVTNDVPLNTVQEVTGGDETSVWKNQHGQIVGYGETFEFTVLGNETITKETSTALVEYVTFRGPFTLREGHNSYVGRFELGVKEVIEYGFVLSDNTKLQASTLNAQTNEFLGTFASTYNVVGTYVTYLEGTTLTTITSDYSAPGSMVEKLIYETGFESSDGFTASDTYNNTTIKSVGDPYKWGVMSGTPSTDATITGSSSLQMRMYKSTGYVQPYLVSQFTLSEVTKIEFNAKNTSGNNVEVSISTDGTNFVSSSLFTLTTSSAKYTYMVPEEYANAVIYIKFSYIAAASFSDKSKVIIDDVVVYGMVEVNPAQDDLAEIVFDQTEFDVETNLTLPTVGSINGSTITWISSHPDIISSSGVMTLPENTTLVTLTATATNTDGSTATKEFEFNLIGIRTRALEQLDTITLPSQVDEDITLPIKTDDDRFTITWESNHSAITINGNVGIVTRDADQDIPVVLTAIISESSYTITKTYDVTVVKEGGDVQPETFTVKIEYLGEKIETNIPNGSLSSYLTYTQIDNGIINPLVNWDGTNTSTKSIFNNESSETRLYVGGKLNISVENAKISKIEWTSNRNNGATIGGEATTALNGSKEFAELVDSVEIVATGAQFRIKTITITYVTTP